MFQSRKKSDGLEHKESGQQPLGLLAAVGYVGRRIVGCWHREMSRPFTVGGETYRVCLGCGARRQFISECWETTGRFYREVSSTNRGYSQEYEKTPQDYEKPIETVSATVGVS